MKKKINVKFAFLTEFAGKHKREGIIVACVLLAAVLTGTVLGRSSAKKEAQITAKGLSYLSMLDQRSPSDVESKLKEARDAKLQAEVEARMQELTDGTVDVWSLFDDAVLMGDSRVEEISNYEFLPKNRVLAHLGANIRKLKEDEDALLALNPSYVFLGYGINDTEQVEWWPDADAYIPEYKEILKDITAKMPDTKFYVNSIIPAQDWTFDEYPTYAEVPEWNVELKKMCEELGVGYIDCDQIAADNQDLYEGDGIHFLPEFYKIWMAKIWTTVYQDELEGKSGAAAAASSEEAEDRDDSEDAESSEDEETSENEEEDEE